MNEMDALGIAPDGSYAIAIQNEFLNTGFQFLRHYRLWKYVPREGRWSILPINGSTAPLSREVEPYYEAGAFNPKNGEYYFGYFKIRDGVNGQMEFELHRVPTANPRIIKVASIKANWPSSHNVGLNGDIAFDDRGNLYILAAEHDGNRVQAYVVEDSALTRGGTITPELLSSAPNVLRRANGIALRAQAGTVISGGTDDRKNIGSYDLVDLRQHGAQPKYLNNLGQTRRDLASCEKPNTMVVKKDIAKRHNSADQFNLLIEQSGPVPNTITPTIQTTGLQTGVQNETAGPVPIIINRPYKVSESQTNGTLTATYRPTWNCASPAGTIGRLEGASYTLTVPSTLRNREITCTVTNHLPGGRIRWDVIGDRTSTSYVQWMPHTEWTLTKVGSSAQPINIDDCTEDQGCAGKIDQNNSTGRFEISVPEDGEYELRQTASAWQYEAMTGVRRIRISSTQRDVNLGRILNERVAPTEIRLYVEPVEGPERHVIQSARAGWSVGAEHQNSTHRANIRTPFEEGSSIQETLRSGTPRHPLKLESVSRSNRSDLYFNILMRERYRPDKLRCAYRTPDGQTESTFERALPVPMHSLTRTGIRINGIPMGKRLDCTFVVVREMSSVVWQNVDASSPHVHLAGSEWTLSAPGQDSRTVRDCTANGQCDGTGDEDPRPGYFTVPYLKPATYTLTQTTAAAGYQIGANPHSTFTMRNDDLQINHGQIANSRRPAIRIPLTGGDASDTYALVGLLLMASALPAGIMMNRRRLKQTS